MKKKRGKKGTISIDMLGWILIGLAVLVIAVIGILILTGKGSAALEYIKNLFRFVG